MYVYLYLFLGCLSALQPTVLTDLCGKEKIFKLYAVTNLLTGLALFLSIPLAGIYL